MHTPPARAQGHRFFFLVKMRERKWLKGALQSEDKAVLVLIPSIILRYWKISYWQNQQHIFVNCNQSTVAVYPSLEKDQDVMPTTHVRTQCH
jgi:hypothetical protein